MPEIDAQKPELAQCRAEASARTRLLIGDDAYTKLQNSLVVVAGLGGVGGHCAEALARAGVGRLQLVDFDRVTPSNLNRQLVATLQTLGRQKTAAMRERLAAVSFCEVGVWDGVIGPDTVGLAVPEGASFVVDAIDSVTGKAALAQFAHRHDIPIVSCMGAGNRLDASQFYVTDIFSTADCPLARRMRQVLRKLDIPALPVVCSREHAHAAKEQRLIGSLAPVTAAAGLCAAGYVINELIKNA